MLERIQTTGKRLLSNRLLCMAIMLILAVWMTAIIVTSADVSFGGVTAAAADEPSNVYALEPNIPTCLVHITADGKTIHRDVPLNTVENAISKCGLILGKDDQVKPGLSDNVEENMEIKITRVEYKKQVKTVTIPYKTVYRVSSDVPSGSKKILQKGINGKKETVITEKYVDGKKVSSKTSKETVIAKAQNEICLVGTIGTSPLSPCPFSIDLDANGQPVNFKSKMTGTCTAYTSDRGNAGTVCSTGLKAQVGVVAVDPNQIPYGSKLYIVSPNGKMVYGYAIAGDCGGGSFMCDLFMNTYEECIQFGRRPMNVYILE